MEGKPGNQAGWVGLVSRWCSGSPLVKSVGLVGPYSNEPPLAAGLLTRWHIEPLVYYAFGLLSRWYIEPLVY